MASMPLVGALKRISVAGSDNTDVVRFAWAHGLAAAGDAMVTVSLAGSLLFAVSPDASRRQVLIYLALALVPFIVIAPLVGPAIDRFSTSHRLLATVCFAMRAATAAALGFFLFDLALYPLALAALVLNKVSGVIKQAIVPTLVDDTEQLVAVNSYLARVSTLAGGVGGAVGTSLLVATRDWAALIPASLLFAAAALAMRRVPDAVPDDQPASELIAYHELHTPTIQATSNAFAALRGAVGFFVFGLAFALRRESAPAWMYGVAVAAFGAATFVANVVSPWLRRHRAETQLMTGSLFALFICAVFAAIGPSSVVTLVVAGILGLSAGIGRQAFDSLVQRSAPLALRGRAFARFETRFQLAWAVGGAVATALATSIQTSMAVMSAVLAPAIVLYLRAIVEAGRFSSQDRDDAPSRAQRHLVLAIELVESGRHASAAVEVSAGIDALIVDDDSLAHPAMVARARELRAAALDGGHENVDSGALRSLVADLSGVIAATRRRDVTRRIDEVSRPSPST